MATSSKNSTKNIAKKDSVKSEVTETKGTKTKQNCVCDGKKQTSDGKANGTLQSKTKANEKGKKYVLRTILVLALIFGAFVAIAVALTPESRTAGTISTQSVLRNGTETSMFYHLDKTVKQGDQVTWYVNGKKVSSDTYNGKSISLSYTPEKTGLNQIAVKAGKYTAVKNVIVKKPLLIVKADDVTMCYGDDDMDFTCTGTLGDKSTMPISCNCRVVGENTGIGSYQIVPSGYFNDEYEVIYRTGTLTVKPCELQISVNKTYDASTEIALDELVISGVLDDEDVTFQGEIFNTESKDVGEYTLSTNGLSLEGADKDNYVLPENFTCTIFPKRLVIRNVNVCDKSYDGTTKAIVKNAGTLEGVIYGDNVAVGELDVSFENADTGLKDVVVNNVTIVGVDKNNYYVDKVFVNQAEITETAESTSDNSVKSAN